MSGVFAQLKEYLWGDKWYAWQKHCYVTGASSGLGLKLAVKLAERGAHVTLVARNQERLDAALKQVEAARVSEGQRFHTLSYNVATSEGATEGIAAASALFDGNPPDAVFCCAGKSTPKFFVEMSAEDLSRGLEDGYWAQAWTAWAASKALVRAGKPGKIVFVASILAYMSIVGYGSYSPAKFALRGLADTLRNEFVLYDIDVHIFFPPTMYTPGYEEENKTKPKITLKIEEDDSGLTPEQAADALLKGVAAGHAHITGDILTEIFRASTRGSAKGHNWIWDSILDSIGHIAIPIWVWTVDKAVKGHRAEHKAYLAENKFFSEPSTST
ncbi:oxidoreductase [Punctularia strigosozonata HHB-11173 SS5]|uniref:oxidoreductase n=1 Tax=Punctularia strigosozonata (strain HHB-11173) TaxID=741275 RepID=UPI00044177D5|nr:oxidoreductase [Punctularia strigosozonata HHB-11173 SS5]EIN05672.1 oxidoreductase [Punctularia strigosozonata HHB-11173 SS5]